MVPVSFESPGSVTRRAGKCHPPDVYLTRKYRFNRSLDATRLKFTDYCRSLHTEMPTDPTISSMPGRGTVQFPRCTLLRFSITSSTRATPAKWPIRTASAQIENPACGDVLKLTLRVIDRRIARNSISRARMRSRHGLRLAADRTGAGKDDRRSPPIAPGRTGASYRRSAQGLDPCQPSGDGRAELPPSTETMN